MGESNFNVRTFAAYGCNVGTGYGVFSQKQPQTNILEFKTLNSTGNSIALFQDSENLYISGASANGEANTGTNLGSGQGVFESKSGVALRFKSIAVTGNLSIASNSTTITISGGSGGGSSSGITQANNGLSVQTNNVVLGGTLTGDTVVDTNNFGLSFSRNGGATGQNAFNLGYQTCASGNYGFASGCLTCACGVASHATGRGTCAVGDRSHALNNYSRAFGASSHAEGTYTRASGASSHSEGNFTCAIGINSHSEGLNTCACGAQSHAEGCINIAYGDNSHVEGCGNCTFGCSSHAEGTYTCATGTSAHAEGNQTKAYAINSHAQGCRTCAIGSTSHSEGFITKAFGNFSHAEGIQTYSCGLGSHSEGGNTMANGDRSHAEGFYSCTVLEGGHAQNIRTIASGRSSHAGGLGYGIGRCTIAGGCASFNHSTNSGLQTIGHGALANFSAILGGCNHNIESTNVRAAIIGGDSIKLTGVTYIDTTAVDNLAIISTPATGTAVDNVLVRNSGTGVIRQVTQASIGGTGGTANPGGVDGSIQFNDNGSFGGDTYFNWNSTGASMTIGNKGVGSIGATSLSVGEVILVSGTRTFASGYGAQALGNDSFATGNYSCAIGDCSFAINNQTIASGASSFASGYNNCALGDYSHVEGRLNCAIGSESHAEGYGTCASGVRSHSEGALTQAIGPNSHAEGGNTRSCGTHSHSEGCLTHACGLASHTEGCASCAIANISHAEGQNTKAYGLASHSEGSNTVASGSSAHAEGTLTVAYGNNSHSQGLFTRVYGSGGHVGGEGFNPSRCIIACGDASFNHSCNSNAQTIGHGALANSSAILGGLNHNIETGNTNAAIIGGNAVKLTGSTYIDTTAVDNLAIMSTPATGVGTDNVLVRNSGTGIIREVTQASLTGGSGGPVVTSGTFTPTISFGGASVGVTYLIQTGSYYKIGDLVWFTAQINLSSKGSSTGSTVIEGLPFSGISSIAISHGVDISNADLGTKSILYVITESVGTDTLPLIGVRDNLLITAMDDGDINNNTRIIISGTYQAQ